MESYRSTCLSTVDIHIYVNFRDGVRGPSPLLDLPGFDIIYGMPPEYMHNICSGIVKALMDMTFKNAGGEWKKRRHNNKMIDPTEVNAALMKTKVPSEFQRATRGLSPGSWKSEESRNMLLFFFPIVHRYGRSLSEILFSNGSSHTFIGPSSRFLDCKC